MQKRFDEAVESLQTAAKAYAPCFMALLRHAAGMICFMCDPQWETYLYSKLRGVDAESRLEEEVLYQPGNVYSSVATSTGACTAIWAGCQDFARTVRAAVEKLMQCPLAKQVEAPLPDFAHFESKPHLCEWARNTVGLHPMPEVLQPTRPPVLPSLPRDALTTTQPPGHDHPVVNETPTSIRRLASSSRRLTNAATSNSSNLYGRSYLVVIFNDPDEVLSGRVPVGDRGDADKGNSNVLQLDHRLGGSELGEVKQVAFGDTSEVAGLFFATSDITTAAKFDEIVHYQFKFLDGSMVLHSPRKVWPALGGQQRRVNRMRVKGGDLYVADSLGHISRISKESIAAGSKTDGVQLFATNFSFDKDDPRITIPDQVTGLYVSDLLFWSTASEVFSAARDGPGGGDTQTCVSEETFYKAAGLKAEIVDLAVDSQSTQVFLAVHNGGATQACSVWMFPIGSGSQASDAVKLNWKWDEGTMSLSLASNSDLFMASPTTLFRTLVPFKSTDIPENIFGLTSIKDRRIIEMQSFFVRGTDCKLGEWVEIDECTATCGGGRQKYVRPIIVEASGGGKQCPSERTKYETCNVQKCPDEATDCIMGQWINTGPCSKTCGYGKLVQHREVLRSPANNGAKCPEGLTRTLECRVVPCSGIPQVIAAMPGSGVFSSELAGQGEKVKFTKASVIGSLPLEESGNLMATDSDNMKMYMAKAGGTEVYQWSMSLGEGDALSMFSKRLLWEVPAQSTLASSGQKQRLRRLSETDPNGLVDIVMSQGALYTATAGGLVMTFPEDQLLNTESKPWGRVLYKDAGFGLGLLSSLSVVGTYLVWTTPTQVTLGSTDGLQPLISERPLIEKKGLETFAGSQSVQIVQAKLTEDGTKIFMLLWNTDQAGLSLVEVKVDADRAMGSLQDQQLQQLRHSWTSQSLRLMITPFYAFAFDNSRIWSFPLDISESTSPALVYQPTTSVHLSAFGYIMERGVDCKISGWKSMTKCSATCGGGVHREARLIEKHPEKGGDPCPAELVRELRCNTQPCPKDCVMSEWASHGDCSLTCGGGTVKQIRSVQASAQHGGTPCSDLLERTISCNSHPCSGVDCKVSEWITSGPCSKTCGAGVQKQLRKITRQSEYGGLSCSSFNMTRLISCNPTPCKNEGFDPVASGGVTGFDFDVSDYCDRPEDCADPTSLQV
eukprot:TRINITY_DN90706_c0_g1_i1.p1 TRINITY_DN90706_c0_g1~~TRINITY_DN90706_c0_g1_i1.p1  ORF type:complete len:1304 (-),score=207.99 TRINITY_DN90706_c0_g1_i1:46-3576(-)